MGDEEEEEDNDDNDDSGSLRLLKYFFWMLVVKHDQTWHTYWLIMLKLFYAEYLDKNRINITVLVANGACNFSDRTPLFALFSGSFEVNTETSCSP